MPTKTNELPSKALLRRFLRYDPLTGIFTWKVPRGGHARAGSKAGSTDNKGYVRLRLKGHQMLAHRVAWLLTHAELASDRVIDHINNDPSDNRLINLRLVTGQENLQNRAIDGGVVRSGRKWRVHGVFEGKSITVGTYTSEAAAYRMSEHWRRINYPGYVGGKPKRLKSETGEQPPELDEQLPRFLGTAKPLSVVVAPCRTSLRRIEDGRWLIEVWLGERQVYAEKFEQRAIAQTVRHEMLKRYSPAD
jgi:hypothetical protein